MSRAQPSTWTSSASATQPSVGGPGRRQVERSGQRSDGGAPSIVPDRRIGKHAYGWSVATGVRGLEPEHERCVERAREDPVDDAADRVVAEGALPAQPGDEGHTDEDHGAEDEGSPCRHLPIQHPAEYADEHHLGVGRNRGEPCPDGVDGAVEEEEVDGEQGACDDRTQAHAG